MDFPSRSSHGAQKQSSSKNKYSVILKMDSPGRGSHGAKKQSLSKTNGIRNMDFPDRGNRGA